MPVVQIDGVAVGGGKPGPIATRLREIYIDEMRKAAAEA
jgi:D-alanine transaminase